MSETWVVWVGSSMVIVLKLERRGDMIGGHGGQQDRQQEGDKIQGGEPSASNFHRSGPNGIAPVFQILFDVQHGTNDADEGDECRNDAQPADVQYKQRHQNQYGVPYKSP